MSEIDLFLPNMRGASVQQGSRVHALFLVTAKPRKAPGETPRVAAPQPVAAETSPAPHPWLVRRHPKD